MPRKKPNSLQAFRIQICKQFFLTPSRCWKLIIDFYVCKAQAIGFPGSLWAGAGTEPYVTNVNDTKWKGKLNGCQPLFGWQQLVTTLGISQVCGLTVPFVRIHHAVNEAVNPFLLCLLLVKLPLKPCLHTHFTATFGKANQHKGISWSFFAETRFRTLLTIHVVKFCDCSARVTAFPQKVPFFQLTSTSICELYCSMSCFDFFFFLWAIYFPI